MCSTCIFLRVVVDMHALTRVNSIGRVSGRGGREGVVSGRSAAEVYIYYIRTTPVVNDKVERLLKRGGKREPVGKSDVTTTIRARPCHRHVIILSTERV